MTVSASLPTIPPSFQPATTSKDQRIRARTYTNMRLGARNLNLRQDMDPQTYILWDAIMELFNEAENGIRFPEERELTTKSIIAEGGAPSRKSFFRTRQKLSEFCINGKPLVEITGGENHGSDTSYTFVVHWNLLSPYPKITQFPPDRAETEPSRKRDGLEKERKEPKERKEDLDLRKEPKPNVNVVTTGKSKTNAKTQVSGSSFKISEFEDLEMVRSMVRYGVNKNIIVKAIMKMGKEWVNGIYREFNADVQKAHRMKSEPAVLAIRLKDYVGSWRKQPVETLHIVPPGLIDEVQARIDLQFEDPEGKPEGIPSIIRDYAMKAQIPFRILSRKVETYGVGVDFL